MSREPDNIGQDIRNAEDHLHATRELVEACFMAANGITDREQSGAMTTVIDIVKERLVQLGEMLDLLRQADNRRAQS